MSSLTTFVALKRCATGHLKTQTHHHLQARSLKPLAKRRRRMQTLCERSLLAKTPLRHVHRTRTTRSLHNHRANGRGARACWFQLFQTKSHRCLLRPCEAPYGHMSLGQLPISLPGSHRPRAERPPWRARSPQRGGPVEIVKRRCHGSMSK